MDIEGLGDKQIELFYAKGLITTPADIFSLQERNRKSSEKIEDMEGFGETSVANLFAAIESRRAVPLNRFFFALGIPEIGETAAKLLARHEPSANAFVDRMTHGVHGAIEIWQNDLSASVGVLESQHYDIFEVFDIFHEKTEYEQYHMARVRYAPGIGPIIGARIVTSVYDQSSDGAALTAEKWLPRLQSIPRFTAKAHAAFLILLKVQNKRLNE